MSLWQEGQRSKVVIDRYEIPRELDVYAVADLSRMRSHRQRGRSRRDRGVRTRLTNSGLNEMRHCYYRPRRPGQIC